MYNVTCTCYSPYQWWLFQGFKSWWKEGQITFSLDEYHRGKKKKKDDYKLDVYVSSCTLKHFLFVVTELVTLKSLGNE